ncbi:HNH endonuclease signature motif containing protein [Corynebacterium sp. H130]|uniref:HNH endonuclease signature motif containing protein n=1 Tax=Corynebacterium sp. H130 TaxID=3133444 RepID=UPI003096495A
MFSEFAAAHAPGFAILDDCARLARLNGVSDLAAQSGLSEAYIRTLLQAHKRLQEHACLAEGIPVHTLILVSRWAKKMQPDAIPALLESVRHCSYDEAEDHLRAAIHEFGKPKPPRGTVGVAKRPDFWGRRRVTFHLTDNEWAQVREMARPFIDAHREELTYGQALDMWFKRQLLSSANEHSTTYKPVLLLPADPSLIWDRGYLVTADGARVRPEELLEAQLDGTGWALQTALDADGIAQTVTVARIQDTRFSTGEHRMIASLETLVCSWPGCHRVAGECQSHHIDAYANGGETSWENLTPLCAIHNGMNDKANHGRIVRGNGGYPGHQRRHGDPIRYSGNDLLTSGWRGLTYDYYASRRSTNAAASADPPQP